MSVLGDIKQAVEDYPRECLKVEIFDVHWPGDGIDVDEDMSFRVRVSNTGTLHVEDLQLKVEGLNGTKVKSNGAAAQYVDWFTTGAGWFPRVDAHTPNDPTLMTGNDFFFKPSRSSTTLMDLVRVSVYDWTSSFDHVFAAHTDPDTQAGDTYSSTVDPD